MLTFSSIILSIFVHTQQNHLRLGKQLLFLNRLQKCAKPQALLKLIFIKIFESFRCYTGFSPGKYLLQVRIKQARILLKTSTASIEVIATSVGFKDAGHFSQMFKKEVGITPLKYRKDFLLIQASPHPLLIAFRNPAGDLLDLVKRKIPCILNIN